MKKHILIFILILFLSAIPLSADNFFAIGADWSMFGAAMSKDNNPKDLISSNSAGFSCTYYSGEKWGYFIGFNLNYLGAIITRYNGESFSNFDLDYGIFSNITADILVGPSYFFKIRDDVTLMVGLGAHFGAPYLPDLYERQGDGSDVLLAFTMGGGMKALLQIKHFYISLDLSYDMFMPNAPFGADDYFGGTITPAFGYVYYYPIKE